MKSIFFLCVIFVLVACYSGSPVAKKSKLVQGIQSFAEESQPRSKRSAVLTSNLFTTKITPTEVTEKLIEQPVKLGEVKLLPGIASAAMHFSEEVSKTRNKRSNGVMLNALAQLQEGEIASNRIAKIFSSDLVDSLAEEK